MFRACLFALTALSISASPSLAVRSHEPTARLLPEFAAYRGLDDITFRGRVVDTTGKPLANVSVQINVGYFDAKGKSVGDANVKAGMTDACGLFAVQDPRGIASAFVYANATDVKVFFNCTFVGYVYRRGRNDLYELHDGVVEITDDVVMVKK